MCSISCILSHSFYEKSKLADWQIYFEDLKEDTEVIDARLLQGTLLASKYFGVAQPANRKLANPQLQCETSG